MSQDQQLVFLRDLADVEPPRDRYSTYEEEDIYRLVPRPQWTGLEDEIWTPRSQEHDPQLERVKALMKRNAAGASSSGEDSPTASAFSATRFATKLARKKRKNPRMKVKRILNNKFVEAFINIMILWSLFMEDIRVLALPKRADVPIWYIHCFAMGVFALEMVLRWYAQSDYKWSFFFRLDFLATGSIFMDFLPLVMSSGVDASGADMFRAAKTARIGARLARLVRVLRIIRVLKLFVQARGMKKGQVHEDEAEKEDEGAPSELSKALQGQITKKTIVFVLALLGSQVVIDFIPYAGVDIANLGDSRARLGMAQLFGAIGNGTTPSELNTDFQVKIREQFRAIIQSKLLLTSAFFPQVYTPLFRLDIYVFNSTGHETGVITYWPVPGQQSTVSPDNSLLIDATSQTYHTDPSTFSSLTGEPGMPAWVPSWPYADSNWPNCEFRCLDTVANNCINDCPNARGTQAAMRDLRVIGPPEILQLPFVVDDDLAAMMGRPELMGKQVIRIWFGTKAAEDIQAGMSIILIICITILLGLMGFLLSRDVDKMVIRPIESMVSDVTKLAANPAYRLEEVKEIKYETDALKMSLGKIATMLQVGFGEAGNNLVAENLKKGDTVDPMVPGRKLLGAYGFCIIDEYEEVLECLGEEILPFTNTAAKVVHDAVSENGGQPNRNLGEAFLCVWKPDYGEDTEQTISPANLEYAETKMCDGALTAFRRCVRGISMSGPLQAYNNHDEIVKFFDGTYTTRIGYGLHYGWAIEGAVGTNIKIDCSYLSPNVNLAARLESATKMYGVNVLMSESFRDKLSPSTQGGLRRVDVVCLKGSSIPMAIYTCDRSNAIYVAQRAIDKYGTDKVVTEFQRIFEEGMDEFVAGNWQASKGFFETALTICPRDIPSQRILMHMDTPENHPDYGLATTPFNAPEGWPGYHILLSK